MRIEVSAMEMVEAGDWLEYQRNETILGRTGERVQ